MPSAGSNGSGPPVAAAAHRRAGPAARIDARRRADRHRLAQAGDAAAGQRACGPCARSSSRRSSRTSSRTSAVTTTWSTCCRPWSRRCCSTTPPCGGCRARIRAERENCCDDLAVASAATRSHTPGRLPISKSSAEPAGSLVMAANGASLVHRISRLLGAPSHTERTPAWLAGGLALVLLSGIAAGAVGTETFRAPGRAGPRTSRTPGTIPAMSSLPAAGAGPGFAKEAAVQPRDEELAVRSNDVEPVVRASDDVRQPVRDEHSPVVVPARPASPGTEPVLAARGIHSSPVTGAANPQPAVRNVPVVAAATFAFPAVAASGQTHVRSAGRTTAKDWT